MASRQSDAPKVYEALAAALVAEGTEVAFCVLGDGNLELMAHLAETYGVRLVHARHEQGAVAMADGYARVTGRVGVCSVTHGPGLANTAGSLLTAAKARSSVVLIAGDTPTGDVQHAQYFEQTPFITATAGAVRQLGTPATVFSDVDAVFRHARGGHGPIALNAPREVLQAPVVDPVRRHRPSSFAAQAAAPDEEALERAVAAVAEADRPILLCGRGVLRSTGALDAVLGLADLLGAPLATTLMARGLFNDHPRHAGVCGGLSTTGLGPDLVADADCIIAVGAGLNGWTTIEGSLTSQATVVHIDSDPDRIGWITRADVPLVGDAGRCLRALDARLRELAVTPRADSQGIEQRVAECGEPTVDYDDGPLTVDPRRALHALDATLGDDRLVVHDGGHFAIFAAQLLTVPDPRGFLPTYDFGAIGQGLGVALGACFGRPGDRVTLVVGDGGLMLSIAELDTAVRYSLPITIFVMNDEAYGQERHSLNAKGFSEAHALHPTPELVDLARSFGTAGARLSTAEDLDQLPELLGDAEGPLLVDVRINGRVVSPLSREIAKRLEAMAAAPAPV